MLHFVPFMGPDLEINFILFYSDDREENIILARFVIQ